MTIDESAANASYRRDFTEECAGRTSPLTFGKDEGTQVRGCQPVLLGRVHGFFVDGVIVIVVGARHSHERPNNNQDVTANVSPR